MKGDVPLFTEAEVAELHRIADAEKKRERLRMMGARLARVSRKAQGLPPKVQVTLWD